MHPRLTYWTGTWDPAREALSKEVAALRDLSGRRAPVVSFSSGQRSSPWMRDGVVKLSSRRWLTLRGLAPVVERCGDVSHVFGGFGEWHLLRALGRRPLLFTVAIPGRRPPGDEWRKVSHFAAETRPIADALIASGVSADRVSIVYPGVDLLEYSPVAPPSGRRFRILFASSPADPREFSPRGIPFLVDFARRHADVDVVLLWREWGNQSAARRALAALSPPPNLTVEARGDRQMAEVYRSVHAVTCAYEDGFGKSCPNSVVEGLACGRPALVSRPCGIASLVAEAEAGVAFARTPDGIDAALEHLRAEYDRQCINARQLAVDHFDLAVFRSRYRNLYDQVATASTSASTADAAVTCTPR